MHLLYQFIFDYPALAAVQALFTLWMLVDLFRTGGEQKWYWIILIVPMIGPVAYFVVEVLPRWRGRGLDIGSWFHRPASLEELRFRAEQSPTLANHLALAQRLIQQEAFTDAVPHLEAAAKREPDHGQVLYAMALCRLRLGQPDDAYPLLSRLIQRDPRWSDFAAMRLMCEVHDCRSEHEESLLVCREIVKMSPTLQNQCTLAEELQDMGRPDEARRLLEKALAEHAYHPAAIRRRNRRWAKEAKRLLRRGPTT